jgi:CHAT domain-containing protein
MRDYIVRGGESAWSVVGTLPYWFAVIEYPDFKVELANRPRGISVEETTDGVRVLLHLEDGGTPPLAVPFTFPNRSFEAASALALIVLKRFVRLDVFQLDRHGTLARLFSGRLSVPDQILQTLEEAAVRELSESSIHSAGDFVAGRVREHDRNTADVSFDVLDRSKSEELLGVGSDADVVEAALRTLTLRSERAERLWRGEPTQDFDQRLIEAETAERESRFIAHGRRLQAGGPRLTNVERLVSRILPRHTAFAHLGLSGPSLECLVTGADGGRWLDEVAVGRLSGDDTRRAVRAWVRDGGHRKRQLPELLSILETFGRAISEVIAARSIEHLVISPTWYTHALPLHLAPTADGHLIDTLSSLAYATSIAALDASYPGLHPEPLIGSFVYDKDGDIRHAVEEGNLATSIFGATAVTSGHATKAAIVAAARDVHLLHIAAHGRNVIGDHWSSGLEVADGYFSGADARRLRFKPGAVVLLAACSAGLALSSSLGRETFGGLDRACFDAGARAVVSPLWEIDDLAGLLFSGAFLASWRLRAEPQTAYRDAIAFLRTGAYLESAGQAGAAVDAVSSNWREEVAILGLRFTDPYYWGAFRLALGPGGLITASG